MLQVTQDTGMGGPQRVQQTHHLTYNPTCSQV